MIEALYLAVGALISGLVGFGFNKIEAKQAADSNRKAWGSILYSQIYTQPPSQELIDQEAPTIRLLNYSALTHVLNSGAINPDTESDLIDFFSFFEGVVHDVNQRATIFNRAWANGMNEAHLDRCFRDFQISYVDYIQNQPRALEQVQRIFRPKDRHIYLQRERVVRMYEKDPFRP